MIFLFLAGVSNYSYGKDLELFMKDFQCTGDGVKITYSIKNERDFVRPNIRVGFKILVDDKPIACKEVIIDVPVNSNEDQTMEVTIPAPCQDKSFKLISIVFGSSVKRYKIDNWMAECPR